MKGGSGVLATALIAALAGVLAGEPFLTVLWTTGLATLAAMIVWMVVSIGRTAPVVDWEKREIASGLNARIGELEAELEKKQAEHESALSRTDTLPSIKIEFDELILFHPAPVETDTAGEFELYTMGLLWLTVTNSGHPTTLRKPFVRLMISGLTRPTLPLTHPGIRSWLSANGYLSNQLGDQHKYERLIPRPVAVAFEIGSGAFTVDDKKGVHPELAKTNLAVSATDGAGKIWTEYYKCSGMEAWSDFEQVNINNPEQIMHFPVRYYLYSEPGIPETKLTW